MAGTADFSTHAAYRAVVELTRFVYDLEDRFPQDEIPVLYARMKAVAVEAGARIAEGVGRDGLGPAGELPDAAVRETRARLGELRHYVLLSAAEHFIDERHLETFEDLNARVEAALAGRPEPAGAA